MWLDKNNQETVFIDKKREVNPTILAAWQSLPFKNETFDLVLFDPPHHVRREHWKPLEMYKTFGCLMEDSWSKDLKEAFKELFRVLKQEHFLIFKWNSHDKKLKDVLSCSENKALFCQQSTGFGTKKEATYWVCFRK